MKLTIHTQNGDPEKTDQYRWNGRNKFDKEFDDQLFPLCGDLVRVDGEPTPNGMAKAKAIKLTSNDPESRGKTPNQSCEHCW